MGDATAGILVTEDLGTDPSLLGNDRVAVHQGLLAFARGLGTLHAQTTGRASKYHERRARLDPHGPGGDDGTLRMCVAESWQQVQDAVTQLSLP